MMAGLGVSYGEDLIPGTPFGVCQAAGIRMIVPLYLNSTNKDPDLYHCLMHQLTTKSPNFSSHPFWVKKGGVVVSLAYTELGKNMRIDVLIARTEFVTAEPLRTRLVQSLGSLRDQYEGIILEIDRREEQDPSEPALRPITEEEAERVQSVIQA